MLEIKNLYLKNDNQGDWILEDISLSFKNQNMYAILGKSGIGKTSLFKAIALGLKGYKGYVIYGGDVIGKNNLKKYRSNLGFLTQKPQLIDNLTVYENLKLEMSEKNNFIKRYFNIISYKQKLEIFNILEKLGLKEQVFTLCKDLSGGEAQRVEIAKLYIKKPKIILADEPTSSLDKKNSELIIDLIKDLTFQSNALALINMHDTTLLTKNFDHVIGLKNKKIFFNKKPNECNQELLKKLYE